MKLNKLAYCMLLTLPIGAYGNDANDENQELKTNGISRPLRNFFFSHYANTHW